MSDGFQIISGDVSVDGLTASGYNPAGEYAGGTTYQKGDEISYSGGNYVALKETTGNLPTDNTYWMELAAGGTGGAVDSVNGATGVVVLDADDIDDTSTTNKFTSEAEKTTWNSKAAGDHNHTGVYAPVLGADDNYVTDAEKAALHSHANKTLLDTYDQTNVNLTDAVSKKHAHANSVALDAVSGTNTGDQDLSGLVPKTTTVNSKALSGNISLDKTDIGLGNVDNTSDAGKPVSTAQQTALDAKAPLASPQFTTKIGIGVAAANNGLDLLGIIRAANVTTDATNKISYLTNRHYTNAQADLLLFMGKAYQTTNTVSFGGGSATYNSATNIDFYAAADTVTTTGTKILAIDSTGATVTGKTKTTTFEDTTANVISTAGKANYLQTRHLNPRSDNNYDLGDSTYAYRTLYLKSNLTDGTNTLTVANAKAAYDHSQATGDPHKLQRVVEVMLNNDTALTTSAKAYFRIPASYNGMNLVGVAASLGVASSSGTPTFTIKNGTTSMLSTNLTVDQGETDSSTAATAAVIDTNNDGVATGNRIEIACSVAGTGVQYAVIELTFQL